GIPTGYNGGLFAEDPWIDSLTISDAVTRRLTGLSRFNFKEDLSLDAPMWYGSGVGRSGEMPCRGGRMRFLQDQIRPQRRASRRCNYLIVGP
ncbi:MAG: hypothetical protein WA366_29690, partial [Pseudolabrys sp.]